MTDLSEGEGWGAADTSDENAWDAQDSEEDDDTLALAIQTK